MTDTRTKLKQKLINKLKANKIKIGEYRRLLKLFKEDEKMIRKALIEQDERLAKLGNIKEGNK